MWVGLRETNKMYCNTLGLAGWQRWEAFAISRTKGKGLEDWEQLSEPEGESHSQELKPSMEKC